MKTKLLIFSLITASSAYSMVESCSNQQIPLKQFPEKSVILCNGDTCLQATITRYDADRDHLAIINLLDKNQSKLPVVTSEFLAPYFSQKIENFEQSSPTGFTVSGNLVYAFYVLRTIEKVQGFIAYMTSTIEKPNQTINGNIALLCIDQDYQEAGQEQLLDFALQDMSHKKALTVSIMMHEDNTVQRSTLEKIGFIDNSQAVKATQQRMAEQLKKEHPESAAAMLEAQQHCYYMKILEENITEEMKNPTPIESTLLNITKANFEQEVLNATKPVVIDVYTNWCQPCRHFAPIFEKVAAAHANYKFVRFNCVAEEQELAKELSIEMFPTILFIQNKKIVGRETGFMNEEILQQKLTRYFN